MRTLKFKTKVTITFYAAVNRNGHPKAQQKKANAANGSKSANHEPGAWPVDLSEISHLFPERSATWLTAASTSNLLPLHQSHCYPNNQSKKLKKIHFPRVSPGDQTADQGAWGLWVRDCRQCFSLFLRDANSCLRSVFKLRAFCCHFVVIPSRFCSPLYRLVRLALQCKRKSKVAQGYLSLILSTEEIQAVQDACVQLRSSN